jgi:ATP-dependent RNA helicase RhlE
MPFSAFGLSEPVLRALREEGYDRPTPIQTQAIPPVAAGRDVLGCAQTGTGKTAAFALPILHRLSALPLAGGSRPIRVLVLTPTRELAAQVGDSFRAYGRHLPLRTTVIFGGVGQGPQVSDLRRGVDIVVATPGRLLDLKQQGHVRLDQLTTFVLDEADRMLDMGFIHDIRKIVAAVPPKRQTLFFSATMPKEIRGLADSLLHQPVEVAVAAVSSTAETVQQRLYFVARNDKQGLLQHLLQDKAIAKVLVFTRTKHGADRVAERLEKAGIPAAAIHGNKSQNQRLRAIADFKSGRSRVLVASDIAARGLDIDEITHVVNFELPNEPETYVHRIGRTGRAGASGIAISFCDGEERAFLRDIERIIRKPVPVVAEHPFLPGAARTAPPAPPMEHRAERSWGGGGGGQRQQRGGGGRRPEHRGSGQGDGGQRGGGGGERRPGGSGQRPSRPQAPRW